MYLKFPESEVNAARAWREWLSHERVHQEVAKGTRNVPSIEFMGYSPKKAAAAAPWATGTIAEVSTHHLRRRPRQSGSESESTSRGEFWDITSRSTYDDAMSIGRLDKRVDRLNKYMHSQMQQNEEILAALHTLKRDMREKDRLQNQQQQLGELPPCHPSSSAPSIRSAGSRRVPRRQPASWGDAPTACTDATSRMSSPVLTPSSMTANVGFPSSPHLPPGARQQRPRRSTSLLVHMRAPPATAGGAPHRHERASSGATGGGVGVGDLLHVNVNTRRLPAPATSSGGVASERSSSPGKARPTPPSAPAPRRARIFDAASAAASTPSRRSQQHFDRLPAPRPPSHGGGGGAPHPPLSSRLG